MLVEQEASWAVLRLPKFIIPNGKINTKLRFWSLTVKSSGASNGGRNRDLQSYSGHLARTRCRTAGHRRCAGKPARYKAGESRTSCKTKIVRQPREGLTSLWLKGEPHMKKWYAIAAVVLAAV